MIALHDKVFFLYKDLIMEELQHLKSVNLYAALEFCQRVLTMKQAEMVEVEVREPHEANYLSSLFLYIGICLYA